MRNTCLNTIFEISKNNDKVIFVGSDLGAGVLNDFKRKYPKRFFMEGISEQYITSMCAGLAMEGLIPYFNTIGTFLTRRNFEQNIVDIGLHNLPVRLIGNGGGLAYASLGPTHQAIEDIAIMRTIPNMHILSPCDANEMKELMLKTPKIKNPIYIRLSRGGDRIVTNNKKIQYGKSIIFGEPKDVLFITTGITTQEAIEASKILSKKGIKAGVLHNHSLKPFDKKKLLSIINKQRLIISVEEHIVYGGLGSIILEIINELKISKQIKLEMLGIKNKFIKKYGSQQELFKYCKIDSKNLVNFVNKKYGKRKKNF